MLICRSAEPPQDHLRAPGPADRGRGRRCRRRAAVPSSRSGRRHRPRRRPRRCCSAHAARAAPASPAAAPTPGAVPELPAAGRDVSPRSVDTRSSSGLVELDASASISRRCPAPEGTVQPGSRGALSGSCPAACGAYRPEKKGRRARFAAATRSPARASPAATGGSHAPLLLLLHPFSSCLQTSGPGKSTDKAVHRIATDKMIVRSCSLSPAPALKGSGAQASRRRCWPGSHRATLR